MKRTSLKYNGSGYYDPTAYTAMKSELDAEHKANKKVHDLCHELKTLAEIEGFTIENRIILKDTKTGKIYK